MSSKVGLQNAFFDYSLNGGSDYQIATSVPRLLTDLEVGWVRLGAASKWGGGLAWEQVDNTPNPYDTTDHIVSLLPPGVLAIVNINPIRQSDLAKYTDGYGTTTPRFPYDLAGFEDWVTGAVRHLGGNVRFITHNEPITASYWNANVPDPRGDYGRLVESTTRAMLQEDSTAFVLLSYMTLSWYADVKAAEVSAANASGWDRADSRWNGADLHAYAYVDQTADIGGTHPYQSILTQIGAMNDVYGAPLDIWLTECATYTGTPSGYPTQTEAGQAREMVRRLLFPLTTNIVSHVAWSYLTDTPGTGYFNKCGLLTTAGAKKLSYFTFQRISQWLQNATSLYSRPAQTGATNCDGIWCITGGQCSAVVWWDAFLEGSPPTKEVSFSVPTWVTGMWVTPMIPVDGAGAPRSSGAAVNVGTDFPSMWIPCSSPGKLRLTIRGDVPLQLEAAPLSNLFIPADRFAGSRGRGRRN